MFVQHQHGVDFRQHRVRDNQRYSYFSHATITKSFKRGLLMVVRAKEKNANTTKQAQGEAALSFFFEGQERKKFIQKE